MLESGDLKSLKHNNSTYNKSNDISYGLGDRFRDAVPTKDGFSNGITEKATALCLKWP